MWFFKRKDKKNPGVEGKDVDFWDNDEWSLPEKKAISDQLVKKITQPCPMCHKKDFALIKQPTFILTFDCRGFRTIMIYCENCGYVMNHLIKPLRKEQEN